MTIIIIRLGELWLKSKPVKKEMVKRLIVNIKSILPKKRKLTYQNNQIYLQTKITKNLINKLAKIAGITSISPAVKTSSEITNLEKKLIEFAKPMLTPKTSFALIVNRSKDYPITSLKIAQILGEKIQNITKSPVNLSRPDVPIYLQIQKSSAYLFSQKIPGLAGLPAGSQGKVVSLISGGIDSPVAAILLIKRGCQILPLHFDNSPFIDKLSPKRAQDILSYLATFSAGIPFTPAVFSYGPVLQFIKENFPKKLTCVFCKRGMFKIANLYAQKFNAQAIASGENLGQVASQTLSNMATITQASTLPVIRPLLTYDKEEIIALSRKFALFNLSTQKAGPCQAVPDKPATISKLNDIINLEKKSDFDTFLKNQFTSHPPAR